MKAEDKGDRAWACIALSQLVLTDAVQSLLHTPMIKLLINCLSDEEAVVLEALGALRNLFSSAPEAGTQFVQEGGIPPILSLMNSVAFFDIGSDQGQGTSLSP